MYCGYVLVNHVTLATVCVNVLLVVGVVSMLMNLEKKNRLTDGCICTCSLLRATVV